MSARHMELLINSAKVSPFSKFQSEKRSKLI